MPAGNYILLFDGECNLCNRFVQFVIKHDEQKKFLFTSLQSAAGKSLLEKYKVNVVGLDTLVFIKNDVTYIRSGAALQVFKDLGVKWKLVYGFIIVPAFIRDAVYNFIAKRRYKVFGKTTCMVPTPELKSRFLE